MMKVKVEMEVDDKPKMSSRGRSLHNEGSYIVL